MKRAHQFWKGTCIPLRSTTSTQHSHVHCSWLCRHSLNLHSDTVTVLWQYSSTSLILPSWYGHCCEIAHRVYSGVSTVTVSVSLSRVFSIQPSQSILVIWAELNTLRLLLIYSKQTLKRYCSYNSCIPNDTILTSFNQNSAMICSMCTV